MNQKRKITKNKINFYIKSKKADNLDFNIKKISNDVLNEFILIEKIKNNIELDVTLCTNAYIKKINKKYRNIDKETDVLSFPMCDEDLTNNTLFLGDVIISVNKLYSQSKIYGHSLKREYAFLLCHSLLHLIGYDHMTKKDENIMFRKQDKILNNINIKR